MSEQMTLNQLTDATSVAATDKVVTVGSNGDAKLVTAKRLLESQDMVTVSAPAGWLRIAQNTRGEAMAGTLAITTAPIAQSAYLVSFTIGKVASFKKSDLTVQGGGSTANGAGSTQVIDKLRVLKPGSSSNPLYIEVYFNEAKVVKICKGAALNVELTGLSADDATLSNYTPIEYDLTTANSGGG